MKRIASWLSNHSELGPFIGLVALCILFHLFSDGKFFTARQLGSVARLSSSVGMIALGVTMLMISGEFDLSVSQTFVLGPILLASFINDLSWTPAIAFCIAVATTSTVGLANGLLTVTTGIPSFIATLGTLFVVKSINRILAGGTPIELYDVESRFMAILGAKLPFTPFAAPLAWMLATGGLLWFVLKHTQHGNATRAVGDQSGTIARAMGVPVTKTKLLNFVTCAGLAGTAGCLQLANFGSCSVDSGSDYNLMAIVAAVIGGTSLFGIRGTVVGSILGAILLGTLKSGLVIIGTSGEYYAGLIGVLLLGTAVLNTWTESLRSRSSR